MCLIARHLEAHGIPTLCLASALRYLDLGWPTPAEHRQRPDIDYAEFERPKRRKLISIDPLPKTEAAELIASEHLTTYVEFVNSRSCAISVYGQADLIFIDGDHSYEGCRRDVDHYIPQILRPGGYFVLHDYFGWYDEHGINRSPVKAVIDELIAEKTYQHLLFDTGYMSFVVFRKCAGQGPHRAG